MSSTDRTRGSVGRPSLAESRREQMLTAIAQCVGRFGLAASTQDVMARESGFSRPLLRHYLGNREEIIDALWDFLMQPYQQKMDAALSVGDPDDRLPRLLDFFFGPEMDRQPQDAAIGALFNSAHEYPALQAKVDLTYRGIETQIAKQLQAMGDGVPTEEAEGVAFSILSLALGASDLSDFSFPPDRRAAARAAAVTLASRLLDGRAFS
ncbi:TetR/AcrR family transcriptional regulator [Streptomyces sp. NPDC048282]|uniref:TetR/AcrR family transcriptional regulator n=1 Tax=Streptomyces sp. NPDC048282 TaxID=3365528 RepID=UPI003715E69F